MRKTIRKVARELEAFLKKGIKLSRALDLLEASTSDVREIIVLNTMRESVGKESYGLVLKRCS